MKKFLKFAYATVFVASGFLFLKNIHIPVDIDRNIEVVKNYSHTTYQKSKQSFKINQRVIDDIKWLAIAIYFEARNQPLEGQLAVADVILNRAADEKFPDTIKDVVQHSYFPGEINRCQFSFYCDGKPEDIKDNKAWDESINAALLAINSKRDYSGGALYYHADYIEKPEDFRGLKKTKKIANHIFYR